VDLPCRAEWTVVQPRGVQLQTQKRPAR
jgi:hypothetical protein